MIPSDPICDTTADPLGNGFMQGYSPPQNFTYDGPAIDNTRPLLLVVKFNNNERNLQLNLDSFEIGVRWSAEAPPGPLPPVPKSLNHPTNAAIVRRDSLHCALRAARHNCRALQRPVITCAVCVSRVP